MIKPTLASLFLLATFVCADEPPTLSFATRHGREYRNVTLVRTIGRSIEIMTADGLKRVPIIQLPDAVRTQFVANLARYQPPKIDESISFQTTRGTEFKNVTLKRVEPDGLTVMTTSGVQKIPFDLLKEDFRSLFDFDADEAAAYASASEVAQAQAAAAREARAQAALAAAKEKELAEAAQKSAETPSTNNAAPPALGTTGAQRLGTPALGGAGPSR